MKMSSLAEAEREEESQFCTGKMKTDSRGGPHVRLSVLHGFVWLGKEEYMSKFNVDCFAHNAELLKGETPTRVISSPWSFRPQSFHPLVISSPGHFVPSYHIIHFHSTK
jgi:hypothetical protein